MEHNYYDIIDRSKEIRRRAHHAVYGPTSVYERYLEREGLISPGDQVVVNTSSREFGATSFKRDAMGELLSALRNQRRLQIGVVPPVIHWMVAFSVPSKVWGVPLPQSEYHIPYTDTDGTEVASGTDVYCSFLIDSHRYGQHPAYKSHILRLIDPTPGTNEWVEETCAPYPVPGRRDHLEVLNKLLENEDCIFDSLYWTIPRNQMPLTW